MKKAIICVALVATFAIASPAVGGPSIGRVYHVAKSALSIGKSARSTARTALSRANGALNASDAALNGPNVIEQAQKDVPAAPSNFAEFDVHCPGGYAAVGLGLSLGALEPVFFASYGAGALASMFNPSSSQVFTGSLYVECVKASGYQGAASAHQSKPQVARELAAAQAAHKR